LVSVAFDKPALLLLAPLLAAALLACRWRCRGMYGELYGFTNPMAWLAPRRRRRGALGLAAEMLVVVLVVAAAAQPYVERRVTVTRDVTASLEESVRVARPLLVVLLDVSGSMGDAVAGGVKIELAKEAVSNLLEGLPEGVDVALVAFNHHVDAAVPPTANRSLVYHVLERLRPGGGTMYTYPLESALSYVRPYRAFNASCMVVLVTDGLPADRGRYDDVLERLRSLGVPVYTVYIGPGGDAGEEETRRIASLTGGREYTAPDAATIAEAFREISRSAGARLVKSRVRIEISEEKKVRESLSAPLLAAALALYLALAYLRQRRLGVTF